MSEPQETVIADQRLYGLVGAEHMHFDPASVYESEIEPYTDEHDRRPIEIEEWSVRPPADHVPSADNIIEWLVETIGENGMLDDSGFEAWEKAAHGEDVVAAVESLRVVLASKVKFRMADKHLRSSTLSWDEAGGPLLDGTPLYARAGDSGSGE